MIKIRVTSTEDDRLDFSFVDSNDDLFNFAKKIFGIKIGDVVFHQFYKNGYKYLGIFDSSKESNGILYGPYEQLKIDVNIDGDNSYTVKTIHD